ncbi:MAG TPA: FtsX-like permease family protein [Thermoleophilaceae bacterium]
MRAFAGLFRRINARHFGEQRLRTLITIGGISAGVALTVSIAVINATLQVSVKATARDPTGAADVEVQPANLSGLPQSAVSSVASVPGVRDAVPFTRVAARVKGDSGSVRTIVLGGDPGPTARLASRIEQADSLKITQRGSLSGGVLLTPDLADEIGAGVGGRVEVETPHGPVELPVAGTVEGSAVERFNAGRVAFMHIATAQATFDRRGTVDAIYVVADPGTPIPQLQDAIRERLHGAGIVGDPGEVSRGFENTLGPLAAAGTISGLVALLVALFIVYNTMSMAFAERRWEVSMALALGASRRQLAGAFLLEALVIGIIASAVGVLTGTASAYVMAERAIEDYRGITVGLATPPVIHARDLLLGGLGGVIVTLLGAAIPARRVFGLAPIESLRPEAAHEWAATVRGSSWTRRQIVAGLLAVALGTVGLLLSIRLVQEDWLATVTTALWLAGVALLLPHALPIVGRALQPALARTFGALGRLAGEALTKNPGRTALTTGALIVSSSMAIAVASGLDSYEQRFANTAEGWFGGDLYVVAGKSDNSVGADQPVDPSAADALRRVEGVRALYPQRYAVTRVGGEPALMYAIPIAQAAREGTTRTLSESGADQDALIRGLGRGEVGVSRFTAARLDLKAGDTIPIATPTGTRRFRIAALFKDLAGFDTIQIEHSTYARYWNDRKVDRFAVLAQPGANLGKLRADLGRAVEAAGLDGRVLEQQQAVEELVGGVEGLVSLARSIQLVALVVAALAIANTLFAAVIERRWEFGLQRVLGMSRSEVARTLLLEAGVIGLMGSVIGVVLGVAMGYVMVRAMTAGYSWDIPFAMPWELIAFGLVGGVAIAAAAGVTPARIATRTSIVAALRR